MEVDDNDDTYDDGGNRKVGRTEISIIVTAVIIITIMRGRMTSSASHTLLLLPD